MLSGRYLVNDLPYVHTTFTSCLHLQANTYHSNWLKELQYSGLPFHDIFSAGSSCFIPMLIRLFQTRAYHGILQFPRSFRVAFFKVHFKIVNHWHYKAQSQDAQVENREDRTTAAVCHGVLLQFANHTRKYGILNVLRSYISSRHGTDRK
jgi:hypothetical protein